MQNSLQVRTGNEDSERVHSLLNISRIIYTLRYISIFSKTRVYTPPFCLPNFPKLKGKFHDFGTIAIYLYTSEFVSITCIYTASHISESTSEFEKVCHADDFILCKSLEFAQDKCFQYLAHSFYFLASVFVSHYDFVSVFWNHASSVHAASMSILCVSSVHLVGPCPDYSWFGSLRSGIWFSEHVLPGTIITSVYLDKYLISFIWNEVFILQTVKIPCVTIKKKSLMFKISFFWILLCH